MNTTLIGVFSVLFSISILVANLGVIFIIMRDRKLRTHGMYCPVLGLTIAGLLSGGYICGVRAYINLQLAVPSSGIVAGLLTISYIVPALYMYYTVFLYVLHLIGKSNVHQHKQSSIGIIGTFIIFAVVIISLAVTIDITKIQNGQNYNLTRINTIILSVFIYFIPVAILCIFGTMILLKNSTNRIIVPGGQVVQRFQFPSHLIAAGFIATFTVGPSVIIKMVPVYCVFGDCTSYVTASTICAFLSYSCGIFLPFCWLLDNEYRQSFTDAFFVRRGMQSVQPFTPMGAYNTPEQQTHPGYVQTI